MKSKTRKLILTAGLVLFPGLSLQASVNSILRIDLRCFIQKSTTSSGAYDYGDVQTVRITSKHLIALVGKEMGRNLPDGGQLKAYVDGRVFVTDSDGKVLVNASKYIQVKLATEVRAFDGKVNRETGVEGSRNYFPVALTFNVAGLKGSVEGVGIEDFHMTSPNSDGIQFATGDIDCTANGRGSVGGKRAYYTGVLNFNGRQAILAE